MSASEKRAAHRRDVTPIKVSYISDLENLSKIAKDGHILDASIKGFRIQLKRENLVPKMLRQSLNIDCLLNTPVLIYLPQLDLEITGHIARTRLLGKEGFEIAIDYSKGAPEYWRECLVDLLPAPGEFETDGDEYLQ